MLVMEHLADEVLVEEVRQGSREAYRLLVDRHKAGVFALIRCRVESKETAEDLAQEVFIKLFRSVGSFRGEARFTTWLYRLTLHVVADYQRSVRRKPASAVFETVRGWFADSGQQPEEAAVRQEERDTVVQLLRRLPVKYREILYLYHYRQLSYSEISQLLELPVKTVETRLYRGKNLLKQQWLEVNELEQTTTPERHHPGTVQKL